MVDSNRQVYGFYKKQVAEKLAGNLSQETPRQIAFPMLSLPGTSVFQLRSYIVEAKTDITQASDCNPTSFGYGIGYIIERPISSSNYRFDYWRINGSRVEVPILNLHKVEIKARPNGYRSRSRFQVLSDMNGDLWVVHPPECERGSSSFPSSDSSLSDGSSSPSSSSPPSSSPPSSSNPPSSDPSSFDSSSFDSSSPSSSGPSSFDSSSNPPSSSPPSSSGLSDSSSGPCVPSCYFVWLGDIWQDFGDCCGGTCTGSPETAGEFIGQTAPGECEGGPP